ncbi:hypothetical protein [Microlunatus soli]|uniref:Uncharacterized protein n=1 Tax=Microlunatus soli TaxID=630515 RepID=A0A1H1Z8C3_9ACTN|nr:hypothetical protein [Microlunatus soli]SDT29958.1 hypothetical protein SAMN04489812_5053 [Microlunatus soli]
MSRLARLLPMSAVLAVLAVAGGMIAMHQLSIGHTVVTPMAADHVLPAAPHGDRSDPMTSDDHHAVSHGAVSSGAVSSVAGPAMPDHDDHDLGTMTCLAVIGLMLLAWLLWLSPRVRCYPAVIGSRLPPRISVVVPRRRNAMSLQELSVCRT